MYAYKYIVTYLGPLGAQYSPVCLISNVLIHSMSESAASSGVTAMVVSQSLFS